MNYSYVRFWKVTNNITVYLVIADHLSDITTNKIFLKRRENEEQLLGIYFMWGPGICMYYFTSFAWYLSETLF